MPMAALLLPPGPSAPPGHVLARHLDLPHSVTTVLQRQPTRTSCGPTVVAMLAGVPVANVLARQPAARVTVRRRRDPSNRTNVGEMRRLLDGYGLALGARVRYWRGRRAVLRLDHVLAQGWHWAALDGAYVFDPSYARPIHICDYHRVLHRPEDEIDARLSFYPVEASA